jgi:hypothetical protein
MTYNFKIVEEAAWAVLVSVAVFALTEIAGHQDFGDWKAWLPVLGSGCVRAAAGAALAVFTRGR